MLEQAKTIAFIATANAEASKQFYREQLGLRLLEETPFAIVFETVNSVMRIQKTQQVCPPPYTSLGWEVQNLVATVKGLVNAGVLIEQFDGLPQDDLGVWISPDGAKIAWFKDPDGNVLSLTQSA